MDRGTDVGQSRGGERSSLVGCESRSAGVGDDALDCPASSDRKRLLGTSERTQTGVRACVCRRRGAARGAGRESAGGSEKGGSGRGRGSGRSRRLRGGTEARQKVRAEVVRDRGVAPGGEAESAGGQPARCVCVCVCVRERERASEGEEEEEVEWGWADRRGEGKARCF
jgi:hypothetical protein